MLLALIVACTAAPADSGETAAPVSIQPVWSTEELSEAVLAMEAAPVLRPQDVGDTFLALLARGDADCPGSTTQIPDAVLTGCTADSGYTYAGFASYVEDPGGRPGWSLTADFDIVDPAGGRFYGGGAVNVGQSDGRLDAEVDGEWGYTGGDGWLGLGVSAMYNVSVTPSTGSIRMQKGLTYAGLSLWFDGVERDPSRCPDGVTGALRVRDPSGGWWILDYGDVCTTCGKLTFAEGDEGTLCLDVDPWLDAWAAG